MSPKRALVMLILVSALVRLIAAYCLGLGNDEAYHFLYALNPAVSFYDHPPMLAWVETIGLSLTGATFSAVALRSGFIALFAGSTWLMWRIAGRWYGPWAGFYAALALNLTGYYGLAASTFALPDGPLLFFWLLTIDRLSVALEEPNRTLPWIWVGLAWGGALLSKYHAIFLPAGVVLFLLVHKPMRSWLRKPGPYLAVGLGAIVFSPVLIWNARNGWVSFLFQGGRAMGGMTPRPDYLAMALLAQVGYLFPWIAVPLIILLFRGVRNWGSLERSHERLGLCMALLPVAIFTTVACFRPVLPHWGLIGLVSLFPALGEVWSKSQEKRARFSGRGMMAAGVFSVALLGLTILEHRTGFFQRGAEAQWGLLDAKADPTADLYGWDQVADRLEQLGLLDEPNTFLFTRIWYQSAQIAHATRLRVPVLCYNIDDPRGFAFWSKPRDWVGHNGIFLIINDDFLPLSFYGRWFESSVPLADFTIERGGKPLRRVRAIRLVNQLAAFPYDFSAERLAAREQIRAGGHPMDRLARAGGPAVPPGKNWR
jgi:hypothetical protein